MIENIPDNIKKPLNEFIIKGKRFYYQRTLLFIPLREKLLELNDKILNSFASVSTTHFDIRIIKEERREDYKKGVIILSRGYTKMRVTNLKIGIDLFSCLKNQNFGTAFSMNDLLNSDSWGLEHLRVPIEEIQKEYDDLKYTLKKKAALYIFNFLKQGARYNKMRDALLDKYDVMRDNAEAIAEAWEKVYPLKAGMTITYSDKTGTRTGTVISFDDRWASIRSSCNVEVGRHRSICSWENKYEDTELCKCIEMLLEGRGIPKEWQENKLEFYS